MGTRNLILVWYRGKWHIAQYCQWDGYPSGQGVNVVRFLTDSDHRPEPDDDSSSTDGPQTVSNQKRNIAALRAALDSDVVCTPTAEEVNQYWRDAEHIATEAERLQRTEYIQSMTAEQLIQYDEENHLFQAIQGPMMLVQPSLSRNAGAQILSLVAYAKDKVPIEKEVEYIVSPDCEWAYVVDLDKEVLEVYRDTERKPEDDSNRGRFDDENFVKARKIRPALFMEHAFRDLDPATWLAQAEAKEAEQTDCGTRV